jgi:uncharacterized membrane-anchored protein
MTRSARTSLDVDTLDRRCTPRSGDRQQPPTQAGRQILAATTLGETGGDSLSMSMGLGYLTSTAIFAVVFVAAVILQIRAVRFNQWVYWFTIIATTTLGTTIADYVDRDLGVGYPGGTSILIICLLASFGLWHRATGTIAVTSVQSPRTEGFYWLTILFSQTLGTALRDWTADTIGLE